jgi:hypothetical protein
MHRRMPYVVCDTTGEPVTPEQAKKIIADEWGVPADVRTRRRSRKTTKGKAPQQVHPGHDKPHARSVGKRGDLPHARSSGRITDTSSTHPRRAAGGHALDEGTAR